MKLDCLIKDDQMKVSSSSSSSSSAVTKAETSKIGEIIKMAVEKAEMRSLSSDRLKAAPNGRAVVVVSGDNDQQHVNGGGVVSSRQASEERYFQRKAEQQARSRSSSMTPDRDPGRRISFSYLSLLESNLNSNRPHRTQSIGDVQMTSRKLSVSPASGSSQEIAKMKKTNLMVRSNPIGLAEPSVKRDGYAVNKNGTMYRSSEHIFAESTSLRSSRLSLAVADDGWNSNRRSSLPSPSVEGGMVRFGSGLISTGKQVTKVIMPFGPQTDTAAGIQANNKSKNKLKKTAATATTKKKKKQATTKKDSDSTSTFIQQGIREIQSLTEAANTLASTTNGSTNNIDLVAATTPEGQNLETQRESSSSSGDYSTSNGDGEVVRGEPDIGREGQNHFAAESPGGADEALEKEKTTTTSESNFHRQRRTHETSSVEFTISRRREVAQRSRSLSKTTLPDQKVTISLPSSRRTSRNPSVDRETRSRPPRLSAAKFRSSSLEIFNGTYEMRVPKKKKSNRAEVREIKSDLVVSVAAKAEEDSHKAISVSNGDVDGGLPDTTVRSTDAIFAEADSDKSCCPQKTALSQFSSRTCGGYGLGEKKQKHQDDDVMEKNLVVESSCKEGEEKADEEEEKARPAKDSSDNTWAKGGTVSNKLSQEASGGIHPPGAEAEAATDDAAITKASQQAHVVDGVPNPHGVGNALKGLTAALESLQLQQSQARGKLICAQTTSQDATDASVSATVSIPSSRRASRQASPARSRSRSGSRTRSRRNSMDLYTADYNMRMSKSAVKSLEQKSTCHIRIEDEEAAERLRLCGRCHDPKHNTEDCNEYQDLSCPRCLEWSHWEDTCRWDSEICSNCGFPGHSPEVHSVSKFKQRRSVVDTVGWEPFREWFYEETFRSWWQLNGCVGVPLYKIYRRSTEWRLEMPKVERREDLIETRVAARRNYSLAKDDSVDELVKSYYNAAAKSKAAASAAETKKSDDDDSGRSTPEYLKGYSGTKGDPDEEAETEQQNGVVDSSSEGGKKRLRTFSETLKMLDEDILAELNVK